MIKHYILIAIPSLKTGGAERVASELANNWSRLGHQVKIITLFRDTIEYNLEKNVEYQNIIDGHRNSIFKIINVVKALFIFRKEVKKFKPDGVLSLMYNKFTLTSLLFSNIPVFISERSSPFIKENLIAELIKKVIYPQASGMITQTKTSEVFFSNKYRNLKIKTIKNPIPLKYFNIVPAIENRVVLAVGRLIPTKGFDQLIECFKNANNYGWKLIIAGNGPEKEKLLEKIKKFNMSDQIKLLGNVSNLSELYSTSSIFTSTSSLEGFPNALCEAMISGVPAVSYDCPTGPSDIIIDNLNGYLIPLNNSTLFTEKLDILMNDQPLRKAFSKQAKLLGHSLNEDKISSEYLNFIVN